MLWWGGPKSEVQTGSKVRLRGCQEAQSWYVRDIQGDNLELMSRNRKSTRRRWVPRRAIGAPLWQELLVYSIHSVGVTLRSFAPVLGVVLEVVLGVVLGAMLGVVSRVVSTMPTALTLLVTSASSSSSVTKSCSQ